MKEAALEFLTSDRNMVYAGTAAGSSYFWLPSVKTLSELAADWLPIVGMLWLFIQMGFFLYGKLRPWLRKR
jgi:hypothetical protein